MSPMTKAIAVATIQVLIVCSLGAKLLYDRHTRPQAWFRAQRYDPNLPIRGRYLNLQVEVQDPRTAEEAQQNSGSQNFGSQNFGQQVCGSIAIRGESPVAVFDNGQPGDCNNLTFQLWSSNGQTVLRVMEPVLFFIPETATDPTPRASTKDELWVLATIPRKGPPRPIALGIKKAGEQNIRRLDLD